MRPDDQIAARQGHRCCSQRSPITFNATAVPCRRTYGGHWTVEMNQSDIEAAIELLAGAVSYLCRLEELALERELRSAPEERREKVGALLNDRDVMRSLAEQLLDLRDRVAEYRRGGGNRG